MKESVQWNGMERHDYITFKPVSIHEAAVSRLVDMPYTRFGSLDRNGKTGYRFWLELCEIPGC